MSLVVSIGGKIESYYSYKKDNLKPVSKSGLLNEVQVHEDERENDEHGKHSHKAHSLITQSYEKQPEKPPKRQSRIFARDIMSSPVRTVEKMTTILEAVHSLNKFKNKHLLVSENELVIGIVSDRDLLSYSWSQDSLKTPLQEVMSNEVIMAKEDAEIKVLARIMLTENISAIPIINDKNLLKGIVTQTDLLKCIMNNMPIDVII